MIACVRYLPASSFRGLGGYAGSAGASTNKTLDLPFSREIVCHYLMAALCNEGMDDADFDDWLGACTRV